MSNFISLNRIYADILNESDDDVDVIDNTDDSETDDELEKGDVEFKFSNNIATELTQTLNEFSVICAKMIKNRYVSKDLYDKFDDVHDKIKNLVDAAKNSN